MKTAYSIAEVAVLANGVPITGFGAGDDVIQIVRTVDTFEMAVGATGSSVPTKSSDESGTITLGLQQGHEDNAVLGAILDLQKRPGTFIPLELLVTELASGERVSGKGVIARPADRNKGTALNRHDWVVKIGTMDVEEGTLPNV